MASDKAELARLEIARRELAQRDLARQKLDIELNVIPTMTDDAVKIINNTMTAQVTAITESAANQALYWNARRRFCPLCWLAG